MAFTPSPFDEVSDLVITTAGAVSFIRFAVGFDRRAETTYLLSVALDRGRPAGGTEFSFWLTEINRNGEEHDFWSGADTTFMRKNARAEILSRQAAATVALVGHFMPQRVYRCTYDANAPTKAYRKHMIIAEIFKGLGYREVELPVVLGVRSWLMEHEAI
jgi:hypothetical protein